MKTIILFLAIAVCTSYGAETWEVKCRDTQTAGIVSLTLYQGTVRHLGSYFFIAEKTGKKKGFVDIEAPEIKKTREDLFKVLEKHGLLKHLAWEKENHPPSYQVKKDKLFSGTLPSLSVKEVFLLNGFKLVGYSRHAIRYMWDTEHIFYFEREG